MSILPRLIHPLRLAKAARGVQGTVSLRDLPRLAGLVCDGGDAEGEGARVELQFGTDPAGRPRVTGSVHAALSVQCQRCLEPMSVVVDAEVNLAIVANDAEAARVEHAYGPGVEPLVAGDDPIETAWLVEDELMLALRATPMHTLGECRLPATARTDADERPVPERGGDSPSRETRVNPFSVLERLKQRD